MGQRLTNQREKQTHNKINKLFIIITNNKEKDLTYQKISKYEAQKRKIGQQTPKQPFPSPFLILPGTKY